MNTYIHGSKQNQMVNWYGVCISNTFVKNAFIRFRRW